MVSAAALIFPVVISVVFATSQNEIDRINSVQNYWKAGHNKITKILEQNGNNYKRFVGAMIKKEKKYRPLIELNDNAEIPETFDARKQWPHCESISAIKNQENCGSCWAVSVASAASDRLCIQSNAKTQVNISAEEIMTCCENCVGQPTDDGCQGGIPIIAWEYIRLTGVVTGGDYESNEGCQPYQIPPNMLDVYKAPSCEKKCINKNYKTSFYSDKHFGHDAYDVPPNSEDIQKEILKHGPVQATFSVYEDFFDYIKGVYVTTNTGDDNLLGLHSIRIFGWGHENGLDYWSVANSWGEDWGENGTFKIKRGTDECDIESNVSAGVWKLK